jgi:hypothetical protein
VQHSQLNLIQARRVRRALGLLCLAWVSMSCSHAAATPVDGEVAEAAREAPCLDDVSWAVLSGSQSNHSALVNLAADPAHQPLNVLKFCLAAEHHSLRRCQFVQTLVVRVDDLHSTVCLLVLPGIPPPSALV